jgi:hypothetical protein
MLKNLIKSCLGFIFGDFFKKASGHPADTTFFHVRLVELIVPTIGREERTL